MVSSGVADYAKQYLLVPGAKCGRHCDQPTTFVPLVEGNNKLVGAYVCPERYVSRVVYFSLTPDRAWFEDFLREQAGDRVRSKDLRCATRHGWEIGRDAEKKIASLLSGSGSSGITEYYWTFYASSDEDKKNGTFLCSEGGCGRRIFTKKLEDNQTELCSLCRSKKT